jgi:hypothetical protein
VTLVDNSNLVVPAPVVVPFVMPVKKRSHHAKKPAKPKKAAVKTGKKAVRVKK